MNNHDELLDINNGEHYECGLPKWLQRSIDKYTEGLKKLDRGEDYLRWDCDYCELQSEINVAEVDGCISSEQAWYLREKYLGLRKESM